MFRHILLPTDGTAYTAITIPIAHDLAERFGGHIDVLRVLPAAADAGQVKVETTQVEQLVARECSHGFKARAYVKMGHVEDVITETAKTQHTDLIILAPRPRHGLDRLARPSVTTRIVGRSFAPMLIVPEQQGEQRDLHLLGASTSLVIVPVDGSEVAERAIPYATKLADTFNRVLVLVHVVAPIAYPGTAPSVRTYEAESNDMGHYLGKLRHHVALETGLTVQSMLLTGNPAQEIASMAQAHDMSLIVMSSHGRSGLARAILGSVATEMLRKISTPLLIVPPPEHLVVEPAYAERVHTGYAQRS